MIRGIPTHRNGPVPTFNDLPFEDDIGSTRKANDTGKIYINTGKNLDINIQWREWDPATKQIVGSAIDTSQFVSVNDDGVVADDVTFAGTLTASGRVLMIGIPAEEPVPFGEVWTDGANLHAVGG